MLLTMRRVLLCTGAVPQLVTAWQGVSRAECQKAYEQAEEQYNSLFQVCQCGSTCATHS
jgi:hypothetical protein